MKALSIIPVCLGAFALSSLVTIPPATADSLDNNAADVVRMLQDQGLNVQFNMPSDMPLSRCTVTGIHGLSVAMTTDGNLTVMMGPKGSGGNVYVDLSCPGTNN
jgi:hypothetical protein